MPLFIDLSGRTFGRLAVAEIAGRAPNGDMLWRCLCDCGQETTVRGYALRQGMTRSCGCLYMERIRTQGKRNAKDIIRERFGRLVVLERAGSTESRQALWKCRCDCGEIVVTTGFRLRDGSTQSCGCLQKDRARAAQVKDVVEYSGAHRRMYRLRGSASQYDCCVCGEPADDWAYSGLDPDELISSEGLAMGCAYSLKPEFYQPMCRTDHKDLDMRMRKLSV